jgi:hypothetical protein
MNARNKGIVANHEQGTVMDQSTPQPPPAAVLQLILNVWAAQSAATFARLGMADLLADGPTAASVVAERAGTNTDATYRLLRGLATVGIVEALADDRFALTPVGQCLRSDVPGSMRSLMTSASGSSPHVARP